MKNENTDWTKKLFEENPELFLSSLKERVESAEPEVNRLIKYLKKSGPDPKKVLDLNCGIGRHTIEMAKKEIEMTGTDISSKYIEMAKKRAKKEGVDKETEFLVADMREIDKIFPKDSFDGIINLWTSFGFYDQKTNEDILRRCRKIVKKNGFFIIEITNRDWIIRNFEEKGFSKPNDEIMVLEERFFELETSRAYNKWTYFTEEGKNNFVIKKEVELDHRIWSLHELIEMFERNGWKFIESYPELSSPENTPLLKSKQITAIFTLMD